MADNKPTFNIFGPPTKKDIRVGYISTDRGYVEGISICEANNYAFKNPGTVFIFKPQREKIKFLNINEVNKLTPESVEQDACEAGTKDSINFNVDPNKPARAVFMGGGGIGVAGNPVIGNDGAVLAVHVVSKGFGYKYPPLVEIRDDLGIGVGAVTRAIMGEVEEQMIYYSDEDDYEVYDFCSDPFTSTPDKIDGGKESYAYNKTSRSPYGRRWSPEGKDIGPWQPRIYTNDKTVDFKDVVDAYIKEVQQSGKGWWDTRQEAPLKITSQGSTSREFYKVKHPAWSDFMNKYAISPKPPSNAKGSDFAGRWFTFEWDLDVPFDGEYVFRGACDNYGKAYLGGQLLEGFDDFENFKKTSSLVKLKKTLKEGTHKLRLDLLNRPIMEEVVVQQPPPPSTKDITFKIASGSMFANGVRIEDLDINEVKPFTPPEMGKKGQLNVTHTRTIEYGKKYKVVFSSKSEAKEGEGKGYSIKYSGLKKSGDRRWVSAKRLEFDDNSENGFDVNGAFTIDSGDAKFAQDGVKLIGSGLVTLTYSWNDKITTAGKALETIKIANRTWTQLNVRRGSETHTIDLGPKVGASTGDNTSNIKLRTKGSNVIQMEDHTDNDWTDIIVVASGGQFTDLRGSIAYFSVPHPVAETGKSQSSRGAQTREVFNTIDYINKANRQLWRTNVYARGGFLNDYGICPFNTTKLLKDNPYAGTHKIIWPNVNFPIDGNYDIQLAVDDSADLTIGDQVTLNKKGFFGDDNVSTGTLKTTKFIKQGTYTITANLYQKPGGAFGFKKPDGTEVQMNDVTFKLTSEADFANKITIPGLFSIGKEYKGAQLNQTVNRKVEAEKDYDVILTSAQSSNVRVRIKDGGKRLEMEEWKDGDWQDLVCTITQGKFHSPQANRCKFRVNRTIKGINPMSLAIKIDTTFGKKEVQKKLSWNQNPMAIAMAIDSPLPPIPQQPIPVQEGRCPNNPFWTTRFPGGAETWYPVRFPAWGKVMNKYAISPLPPLSKEGDARNDEGTFTNTWTKEFPYGGYYKVVMSADNWGELWIDDEKVIDMGRGKSTFTGSKAKLVYIDGPDSPDDDPVTHKIKVVVENEKSQRKRKINAKIFNTLDWIGGGITPVQNKEVSFKITSAADFANGIKIPELGIDIEKRYKGSQLNENFVREVELNKIYDVELWSAQSREGVRLRNRGESVLEMEEHSDNDWKDIVCSATGGRFYDFKSGANNATCKYVVTASTTMKSALASGTARKGVTYEGPHLFHYQDSRWGIVMNKESVSPIGSPNQSLSDPNDNILGWKTLVWKDVDFPQTAEYDITFAADNNAKLFIDDKEILKAPDNYKINEYVITPIKVNQGKHNIRVELFNAHHQYRKTADTNDKRFLSNPTGVVLRIYKQMIVGTGKYKSWAENPMGVSAKIIPPPCPKKVKGKGVIPEVIVDDPGNGYKPDTGSGYPVCLMPAKSVT